MTSMAAAICVGGSRTSSQMPVGKIARFDIRARASSESKPFSNVVVGPTSHTRELAHVGSGGLSRKEQLELEAKMLLEMEDSWWQKGNIPSNMLIATSPKEFKKIVLGSSNLVVGYFFSPQCAACRALWPKLTQIASNNQDITFVKINTAEEPLAALAEGLRVAVLPSFIIFKNNGEQMASFTANLSTVSTLRAELAAAKDCATPKCSEAFALSGNTAATAASQK